MEIVDISEVEVVTEVVEISEAEVVIEVVEVIEVGAEVGVISAAAVVAAVVLRTWARLSSGLPFTIRCSLKKKRKKKKEISNLFSVDKANLFHLLTPPSPRPKMTLPKLLL